MLLWFKNEYTGWDPVWQELFQAATTPFIPRPIYCIPFDQYWEAQSSVTIIGDAAHVMPPFAGEGANMAMLDALELSECLISGKDTLEAISEYEINMRERGTAAAKESLENGERMHNENGLNTMLEFFNAH